MGLRSFVALPVEKNGAVIRFSYVGTKETKSLIASTAYGLSTDQTLLLSTPYRLSPANEDRQGDVSALYRHTIWRRDTAFGTDRLGLLGGAIIPTANDRDPAAQAGFVYTHFELRHEIDIDLLYRTGVEERLDSGQYDASWQYRLSPVARSDWGLAREIYSVIELNGRWRETNIISHQITVGLQWIHQKLVVEGGMVRDINNEKEPQILLSTRFHF